METLNVWSYSDARGLTKFAGEIISTGESYHGGYYELIRYFEEKNININKLIKNGVEVDWDKRYC